MIEIQSLASGNFESARIESELMQHRGMDVGHEVPIFDGVEADFIGPSMLNATPHAATGQPSAKALGMMIAAGTLSPGRAPEFGAENDQSIFEQAALAQILQQSSHGSIHLGRQGGVVRFDLAVGVPSTATTTSVKDLYETNAALDETPGHQALLAEAAGRVLVESVESAYVFRFALQLECFRDAGLHLERQFVGFDPGAEILVVRVIDSG